MNTFQEMGLPPTLVHALDKMKFHQPTPIQAQAIPIALEAKDILGSAQTGTGKTLAFVIPLMAKLIAAPQGCALVLVPTRELAQQVMNTVKSLLHARLSLKTALVIGGEPYFKQIKQLKSHPRIIVGTPGRIIDHIERKNIPCQQIEFLVLDEADRMFDMGFGVQLEQIIKQLPTQRQTLMFSATVPKHIERLAREHLIQPERISIGSTTQPFEKIKQDIIKINETEKYGCLLKQLDERDGSIIIFVKTKFSADNLANKLYKEKHPAIAIHGDLRQNKRERVIKAFRQGRYRIMVATDIAARGLDIPHIQHVINYDLPQSPEDYIHRIGRTARAGADGFALCFVTPQERRKWQAIHQLIDPTAKPARESSERPHQFKRSSKPASKGHKKRTPERSFGHSDKKREFKAARPKKRVSFKKNP